MSVYVGIKKGKVHEHAAWSSDYYCCGCGYPVTDHDSYCPECGGAFQESFATERTCRLVPFVEDDGSVFVCNCSECDAAMLARAECTYCPNCGARVVS